MPKNTFWCGHEKTRLVYKVFSNGSINYYRQCLLCHKPATDWISKKPLGNEILSAVHEEEDGNGLTYPKTHQELKQWANQVRQNSLARYNQNYLDTPEWEEKRQQVFKRDHHRCQSRLRGCTGFATEVHHLTYANVPHEPIDDLISICHHCHEIITAESRREWVTM